MNNKFYWGLGVLFILLIIGATVFVVLKDRAAMRQLEIELEALQKRREEQNTPEVSQEEHPAHGHFHEDGTFHVGEHDDEPEVKYTAPPGAVLEPVFPTIDPKEDPVKAAYKRLEYIKNNPYAWGGVHSERATKLITQLMPPPVLNDHTDSDQVSALMEELIAQDDPRAADVLITNICEGSIAGRFMFDGLVEIGPPAVPYILPYLEKVVTQGGYVSPSVFRILANIAARHRDDLGDIVEHILIPNLITIAADEDSSHYDPPLPHEAQAALEQLQE